MSRAVDGRVRSVFLATTLPPLNVVVVTLATGVAFFVLRVRFLGATGADEVIEIKFVWNTLTIAKKHAPAGVLRIS